MSGDIYLGPARLHGPGDPPRGEFVDEGQRTWYRITNYDRMPPFFMSITNPDDVWMFISTTGGITAGRTSRDGALFPYDTVDKVTDRHMTTGSYTCVIVSSGNVRRLWEPLDWSAPRVYRSTRSVYKSSLGDSVFFEETNHDLGLIFRAGWEASPRFGIHRYCSLRNTGDQTAKIRLLDGVRNIMPGGSSAQFQLLFSNLLDAYKRSESDPGTGLGLFAMSASPTDLAEPSESLLATTVWSYGLNGSQLLISEDQVSSFRANGDVADEQDVKGRRGAYFRAATVTVEPGEERKWGLCGEVGQDHVAVVELRRRLLQSGDETVAALLSDVDEADERLAAIVAGSDGSQDVGSLESRHHHTANVLFNLMRGGYFVEGYTVRSRAFAAFAESWNAAVFSANKAAFDQVPEVLSVQELVAWSRTIGPDVHRIAHEYLPLTFSRRHGDPSRPWNEFFIRTRDRAGSPVVGYRGNWRDIFQNWEALCLSFPAFLPSVIVKFFNATTVDGYNPYRISHEGIDWEIPEPGNPWANIGYWGDHQIVYLSRLMEHAENYTPGAMAQYLNDSLFVFADVPYRIKRFPELLDDPGDTIEFDRRLNDALQARAADIGADGKLLRDREGGIVGATMLEKILILILAKVANFVSGGGIWLNTQRPEWNDANNALAGWGLSVVTLAYLTRYLSLVDRLLVPDFADYQIHVEVRDWMERSAGALRRFNPNDTDDPRSRFDLLESLGTAASDYRVQVYGRGLSGQETVGGSSVRDFLHLCKAHFSATLGACRRDDGMFESYQVLSIRGRNAHVRRLYPMLEGQVAALSTGLVDAGQSISLLDALRSGPLYRADQHSYMLYPNRDLPGFLEKNTISAADAERLSVTKRAHAEWAHMLSRDADGDWHFNASFRNARELDAAAADLPAPERSELLELFEKTFDHASFTGRSGTFFAYEGLGSIYWHMVSKLMLAVQERLIDSVLGGADESTVQGLKDRYIDVRAGLGFNKDPATYGAFPTDPYSHTPWGQGARQPGMTGQVKEEIVARFGELGLVVRAGRIRFVPELILEDQWRPAGDDFEFTFCGVPFTVARGGAVGIEVRTTDGQMSAGDGLDLTREISAAIFDRKAAIESVRVVVPTGVRDGGA